MSTRAFLLLYVCAVVEHWVKLKGEIDINDGSNHFGSSIARCEYSTMRLGTEIADVFNAPIGEEDWEERTSQDSIVANLGFAPWVANGIHGHTMTGKNAKEIHSKSGWIGKSTDESPYAVLNHKWIYMLGDSTTRQVWASFAAPFKGNNFERNAKEWSRHYCKKQTNRFHHVKGGHFPQEGWTGPCGVNEVLCHVSGYGEGGLLSFDWKHFPFEDYDEWMWSERGPWIAGFEGEGTRKPDVLTIQFGLHTCWHALPEGLYSTHLKAANTTMIEQHLRDIPRLMSSIRRVVDHPNNAKNRIFVVVVTGGKVGMNNGTNIDECILRFNRAAERSAHENGFAVLERGELERRLMFKSIHSTSPYLSEDMHLPQPAQNIIATCLLHLTACLNHSLPNGMFGVSPFSPVGTAKTSTGGHHTRKHKNRRTPPARPLHTPPA